MGSFALSAGFLLVSLATISSVAQPEQVPTQALVAVEGRPAAEISGSAVTVSVNDHKQPAAAWTLLDPAKTQIAVLMDDGLRISVGSELDNLRNFIRTLPDGVEVMVGSMQHGSVYSAQTFTTNHEAAAAGVRLPQGLPGASASPYLCLSDFVKKWPEGSTGGADAKARIVLMITNGVDPYNGSTSLMNQDSPYVESAVHDAQRAGVTVYSIYYGDAGIGGGQANLSGQSYLQQIADGTGGKLFYEGTRNPVSMAPFFDEFKKLLGESYVATFAAPADPKRDLVRIKVSASGAKVHGPQAVKPGNRE